ncbi:MAG: STAS domain-containing protein [Chlorobiaceae bacterium]|nr:STAS domain-containing protein [Chlorobiaceae bacterium]
MKFSLENIDGRLIGTSELQGRLDARSVKPLQKLFPEWLEQSPYLVFDCAGLEFIDSSGLGFMVGSLRKTIEKEGDLRLAALTPKVSMVFELTQASKLFSIFSSASLAAASFSAWPDNRNER